MAHFIGYLKSACKLVSRRGHRTSGVTASAQGWNIGGRVEVSHVDGEDRVTLTITRGSHANGAERYAGTWRLNAKGNLMLVREDS